MKLKTRILTMLPQDIKSLQVGGQDMKEDLGSHGDLPASGN